MSRKQTKYRHIILLQGRRDRTMTEIPQPPQHEPIPRRSPNPSPTILPQPLTSHPGFNSPSRNVDVKPGPEPIMRREQLREAAQTLLPRHARRKFRGWVVTRFDVRCIQRLIPVKSENFRLRFRNLNYKRKWNLVWC